MANARDLTAPVNSTKMPTGIPFIIGNEAAERFSFYGMKTILAVFMTQYLMSSSGTPAFLNESDARENVAWFVASAYFFPIIGALIADALLGKYLTIILLSMVYCLGHAALACIDLPPAMLQASFEPKTWLIAGLLLIAIGAGGIKPCVSAHVGDQFSQGNKHLLTRVFGWFYFSINFGSFFSTLLTPILLKHYGAGWAFGVPGVLMAIATLVFWLGRHRYAHIPPKGFGFVKELVSKEGLSTIGRLCVIYIFVAVFWSLYDQTGGAWVLQAGQMDRQFLGFDWLESQIQAINPLLILIYIPLFSYLIYPFIGRVVTLTPLRKIGAGLFLTVLAFAVSATAQARIDAEQARFQGQVAPMVASASIDYTATILALQNVERNSTAAMITTLLAEEKPQGDVWNTKVSTAIAKGGIAISADGTSHNAQWPSIGWQILAYVIITLAEVLVSVTCLEFSYTQAPPKLKSFVRSLYLLSVSAGNVLVALVNRYTVDAAGNSTLEGEAYYWFFTYLGLGAAVVFLVVSKFYKGKEHIQSAEG